LVDSPESMPKEMMHAGCTQMMVSSNRSPNIFPLDGITTAVPRTSIMRGCRADDRDLAQSLPCAVVEFLIARVPQMSLAPLRARDMPMT